LSQTLTQVNQAQPTFGFAAWSSANGSLASPFKAPSVSALKAGLDAQVHLTTPGSTELYVDVSPYYQTDFRFGEHTYGVDVSMTPIVPKLHIGQFPSDYKDIFQDYLTAYIALRPDVVFRDVSSAGSTLLSHGYEALTGYTARAI